MAKGPGFEPIGGIAPVKASISLLSVARAIPSTVNWSSGLSWRGTPVCQNDDGDGPAFRLEYCAGTNVNLDAPADIAEPAFYPYDVYLPYACDWVPAGSEDPYRGDATAALDAATAWHIGRELWTGEIESENPSLKSAATDVSADDPVAPTTAVGLLLEAWSDCTQQGGDGTRGPIIHAPYSVVTHLFEKGLAKEVGDVMHGPAGSLISPGPGYPTGTAAAPANAVNSGSEDAWMYISGPVEYGLGPIAIRPDDEAAHFNPRANRYEITARRQVIHRFDPCCVQAVMVYVPSPPNPAV